MWHELYQNFVSELTPQMWQMVAKSTTETIYMGLMSTTIATVLGLPLGFLAFLTGKGRILENKSLFYILDVVINIGSH